MEKKEIQKKINEAGKIEAPKPKINERLYEEEKQEEKIKKRRQKAKRIVESSGLTEAVAEKVERQIDWQKGIIRLHGNIELTPEEKEMLYVVHEMPFRMDIKVDHWIAFIWRKIKETEFSDSEIGFLGEIVELVELVEQTIGGGDDEKKRVGGIILEIARAAIIIQKDKGGILPSEPVGLSSALVKEKELYQKILNRITKDASNSMQADFLRGLIIYLFSPLFLGEVSVSNDILNNSDFVNDFFQHFGRRARQHLGLTIRDGISSLPQTTEKQLFDFFLTEFLTEADVNVCSHGWASNSDVFSPDFTKKLNSAWDDSKTPVVTISFDGAGVSKPGNCVPSNTFYKGRVLPVFTPEMYAEQTLNATDIFFGLDVGRIISFYGHSTGGDMIFWLGILLGKINEERIRRGINKLSSRFNFTSLSPAYPAEANIFITPIPGKEDIQPIDIGIKLLVTLHRFMRKYPVLNTERSPLKKTYEFIGSRVVRGINDILLQNSPEWLKEQHAKVVLACPEVALYIMNALKSQRQISPLEWLMFRKNFNLTIFRDPSDRLVDCDISARAISDLEVRMRSNNEHIVSDKKLFAIYTIHETGADHYVNELGPAMTSRQSDTDTLTIINILQIMDHYLGDSAKLADFLKTLQAVISRLKGEIGDLDIKGYREAIRLVFSKRQTIESIISDLKKEEDEYKLLASAIQRVYGHDESAQNEKDEEPDKKRFITALEHFFLNLNNIRQYQGIIDFQGQAREDVPLVKKMGLKKKEEKKLEEQKLKAKLIPLEESGPALHGKFPV